MTTATATATAADLSIAALALVGTVLNAASSDPRTADNIRQLQQTPEGAEILRRIVRDDLGGAANVITDALWATL